LIPNRAQPGAVFVSEGNVKLVFIAAFASYCRGRPPGRPGSEILQIRQHFGKFVLPARRDVEDAVPYIVQCKLSDKLKFEDSIAVSVEMPTQESIVSHLGSEGIGRGASPPN